MNEQLLSTCPIVKTYTVEELPNGSFLLHTLWNVPSVGPQRAFLAHCPDESALFHHLHALFGTFDPEGV